ncbi:trichohyalin-like [Amphibalanus amphitrite]|uniref:trichohyalin-like n=1 Tax=Amphibalanus amphitrite TaxID=1232801 RepID=UPI001C926C4F|nr:trichohyalin-like [Amphibalanus amphitrite]
MSATGETEQPPAADLEESVLREERHEGVSEELKVLRRKRGQKLAAFSRVCHRAESIIAVRGSRSTLEGLYATVDAALEGIITANDALEACLSSEADKADAEEYCAKAERDREDIVERITQHLAERKDEPPSETGSVVSVAQKSQTSAVSRASQVEAEVASKIKALRLQQLKRRQEEQRLQESREEEKQRRRQEEQRQEREAERRRQLQDAEDEAEAAQLEADLRRELNDDFQHERRNDFEDELFATEEAGYRSHQREVQPSFERTTTAPSHEMEARHEKPVKGPGSHQMRHHTSWIGELRSPRQTQRAESAAPFSAFAKSIPKLTLPTFSGKASEWPRWSGLFKALVHDQPSLSDTEKIAHLQSSVSGLAQQTISGMLYDGSLYHQALKALEERFGQDDDIIKHNLNSIFNAPDPMEDDAEALERFQATVHCAVTILHSMGADADLHSSDSLHRTVEKLPRDLRREWGKFSLELKPTRPSLLDVDSWLKTQVKISRSCPKGKGDGEEVGARQRKERAVGQSGRDNLMTQCQSLMQATMEQTQQHRGRRMSSTQIRRYR